MACWPPTMHVQQSVPPSGATGLLHLFHGQLYFAALHVYDAVQQATGGHQPHMLVALLEEESW